ncbi:hypothetical protein TNCV_1970521 [Trichonephila clavipes]|uniref:Uncharacterized protein n=1 Tax=Trichonephila clavipes TaxID=2585209 RepID=A0A8X7BFE2_TRICX|nr:hypothetical protein TNCV_1970521 [Trichonephila clavipes]
MNTGPQDLIPIPHNSPIASFNKDVCAAIQCDAYPDYQASTAVMVYFSDIGGQVAGPWFPLYKVTTRNTGGRLNRDSPM